LGETEVPGLVALARSENAVERTYSGRGGAPIEADRAWGGTLTVDGRKGITLIQTEHTTTPHTSSRQNLFDAYLQLSRQEEKGEGPQREEKKEKGGWNSRGKPGSQGVRSSHRKPRRKPSGPSQGRRMYLLPGDVAR